MIYNQDVNIMQNDLKPELIQLFPTPVLSVLYEENFEEELNFIKNIDYSRVNADQTEFFNLQSSDTFLLDKESLSKIRIFIEKCIEIYRREVYHYSDRLIITQSWANKGGKGQKHHSHVHPNSIVSGVFYFQMDENLPPIQFKRPSHDSFGLSIEEFNNFNSSTFILPVKNGELIIFPSSLEHSVPPNKSDKERISLSFNTFPQNSLGSIESLTYLPLRRCL
jgi:uncharacterized protein (TIGR02466 family)